VSKAQASKEYIERVIQTKQKHQIENQVDRLTHACRSHFVLPFCVQKSSKMGPSVSRFAADDERSNAATTIYEFCQDGDEQRVEQMLKQNVDVNQPDDLVNHLT
jgi:hypothetical protein